MENSAIDHMIDNTERKFIGTQPQYRDGSQKKMLLDLLSGRPWVTLPEIMNLRIADYHRVMDYMKDDGYIIECISSNRKMQKHVVYILNGFDIGKKKKSHQSWYARIWSSITS